MSLLNFGDIGMNGLVQILICGMYCFLASWILVILLAIVSHSSCCVHCLRFTLLAVDFRCSVYPFQFAASVFSHLTFLTIGFEDIVILTGRWSDEFDCSGVMK